MKKGKSQAEDVELCEDEAARESLSGHFDRKSIHEAIRMSNGSITEAHKLLESAGLTHTLKWLYEKINGDRVLKAVWVDGRASYSDHEAPTSLSPKKIGEIEAELVKADADFIERNGADKVFGDDAEMMLSFSDFASKSFQTTINMTYGVGIVSVKNLYKRAEHINTSILLNEETETKREMNAEGELVEFRAPKYSQAEKLEWQKQYTAIMEAICKFNTGATAAANAKIAAYKLSMGSRTGAAEKSTRGKRKFA